MINMMEKQAINKIKKIHNLKDVEYIKGELYSIFSILIFSKKCFSKNIDIKVFLEKFNMRFKDYVYVSRPNILSRVLREIQKADETSIRNIVKMLLDEIHYEKEDLKEINKKSESENYLLGILNRYTRNDKK